MPRNRFTFPIRVGCEVEVFGFTGGLYDGIDVFAVATDQLVFHRKIVFRVDSATFGHQVAHMAIRCQHFKVGT